MSTVSNDRTPLFVRLGETETRQLENAVAASGKSKRQLVEEAVRAHLADDPLVVGRVTRLTDDSMVVGRVTLSEAPPEVLTLAEAAALLRVDEDAVTAAVERRELPGRSLAGEWRFSRAALLEWLAVRASDALH